MQPEIIYGFTIEEIIGLLLGSSVVSAFIGIFVNYSLQNRGYRNNYYKRLLEKRINAYEEVENFLKALKPMIQQPEPCKLAPHVLCNGMDYYNSFVASMAIPMGKGFWISDKVSTKLTELNVFFINSVSNHIDDNAKPEKQNEQLRQLGMQYKEYISSTRIEIENLLYEDFKTLHKISAFIRGIDRKDRHHLIENKAPHLQKKR